ncbi:zinc ribbon domain-containing protein [Candidatus Micrarchaeota archaeon]|nr:zinc ribbon domain-containing protein [Candidatus Micrarchaeota archaeon]
MELLAIAYYIYFIVGSVTLGYLLLRLTFPDLRLQSNEYKSGAGAVAGGLLALVSLGIDYIYDGKLEVLLGNGVYPIVLFMVFLLTFVFLKLYVMFSKPDFLTIGVPMQGTINIKFERGREVEGENEVNEKIIGKRSGSDAGVRQDKSKKELITKIRDSELEAVSSQQVVLQRRDDIVSKIRSYLFPKKGNAVRIDEQRKLKTVPIAPQMQLTPMQQQMQALAEKLGKQSSGEKSVQKSPGVPDTVYMNKEAPKDAVSDRKGYMAMMGDVINEKKDGNSQISENIQNAAQIRKRIRDAQMGENESLTGMKAEIMKDQPIEIPKKEIKSEDTNFKSDSKFLGEQRKKAEELQAELILDDILPKEVKLQPERPQIRPGQHAIYREMQKFHEQEATARNAGAVDAPKAPLSEAEKGIIVHRRYLLKGGEGSGLNRGVSVLATNEVAQSDNFDSLVNDVYSQLKTSEGSGSLRSNLSVAPPKETLLKSVGKQEDKMTFNDILGDKPKDEQRQSSVMSQLEDLNAKQPATQKMDSKAEISFVKIEAEKGMGCPTCHSKNSKIIFCPYCGTGMCANCSPSIKINEGAFVYTCPKCKEDVDVRKKAQIATPAKA